MTETSDPFAVPLAGRPPGPGQANEGKTTQVVQSAKESGAEVAQTAAEQVKAVTAEAGHELRELVDQARDQLREQAGNQQRKVVDGLRSLVDELRGMADKSEQSGPATQMVRQSSHFVAQAADWLDEREAGDLIDEVRRLGRRKPSAFLAGAALAGVLAGRLTRGVTDAGSGDDRSSDGGRDLGGGQHRLAADVTNPIPAPPPVTASPGAIAPPPPAVYPVEPSATYPTEPPVAYPVEPPSAYPPGAVGEPVYGTPGTDVPVRRPGDPGVAP
ncbi:hypothetical protein [Labedaea rhizosphaerae]|uniref:Uncharacterized protein n=1 Tax=Labedaea rhizosphaerae TaxID=598644 RepID=A0A4R6SH96_LABRH|nr:hypothetical protein [Labedaea rhizosphaerae]TDQ00298.1 hypothetical protein EV186_102159 [Labedaea rhizosphaerae]